MICNIFETEQETIDAQSLDYAEWRGDKTGVYWDTTIAWAVPQQRLDGKWFYPVCPDSTSTYATAVFDPEWLPVNEDI